MLLPKSAILFDLDGTLLDSIGLLKEVFKTFRVSQGLKYRDEDFARFNGDTIHRIVEQTSIEIGAPESVEILERQYYDLLKNRYTNAAPMPFASETLSFFRRSGYRLGLVTSAQGFLVYPLLEQLCWKKHFDVVVTGDDVSQCKPSPEAYQLAVSKMGVSLRNCVVIEDSMNGIIAAREAGLLVVAIWSSGDFAGVMRESAIHFVSDFNELKVLVREFEQSD